MWTFESLMPNLVKHALISFAKQIATTAITNKAVMYNNAF